MQVLASGQAGLFAIQTATGFTVERLDNGQTYRAGARDLDYYFAGCNDVAAFSVLTAAEARSRAEFAWSADRAVRLFVILLDPQESPEDLAEVGDALDELLTLTGVIECVEAQIFSAPLPQPIDAQAVMNALRGAPLSHALFERFLNLQSIIARVRAAFEEVDEKLFENHSARQSFFEDAIDRGSVRALVGAAATSDGIDGALFKLYSELRGHENSREIIQQWTRSFARVHHNLRPQVEPQEPRAFQLPPSGAAGHQAFQRAMQQQTAIVERIRAADFDTARRYAHDLIVDQRQTSSPEHIAKSLSNISQQAKHLDVIELALEWAQQAVEMKGDDPLVHAQLADLLMRIGRYTEAHQSLDLAQSFGDATFAASGRARILRYQGQFSEALAAYREAFAQCAHDDERKHFDLAGIAECLRDMEQFDEALAAYDFAVEQCPYTAALQGGRAATLVDLSRFDEALAGYQSALKLDSYDLIPRNGIASLYRRAGEFERAETQYRAIIAEYPFDVHSRGGLVATLRELGRFGDAVEEAKVLVENVPASPDSMWILADAQIDAGDFDGAVSTLESAIENHKHSAGLRAGLARVEKAKGRYAAALALYDDAARDFPSSAWLQVGRADMLRRLGNIDEALRIYETSFSRHPQRLSLKNALASIYIFQKRYDKALDLLTVDDPRNAEEWRNFVLRGMLDSSTGFLDEARERFEWGISRCRFRREGNMLRAALTRLQLQEGARDAAIETANECIGDVTELIKFHASAVLEDKGPARALYDRLLQSYLPEPYHELRDEIARQFNVVELPARNDLAWLLARESDALVLEAA